MLPRNVPPRSAIVRAFLAPILVTLTSCSGSTTQPTSIKAAEQAEELPPAPASAAATPVAPPTALRGVLPGNLLIADRANNRVIEVTPDRRRRDRHQAGELGRFPRRDSRAFRAL